MKFGGININGVYRCVFLIQLREEVSIDVHFYICKLEKGEPIVYEIEKKGLVHYPSGDHPSSLILKEYIGTLYESDEKDTKIYEVIQNEANCSYNISIKQMLSMLKGKEKCLESL
jgi:hypothetical protein